MGVSAVASLLTVWGHAPLGGKQPRWDLCPEKAGQDSGPAPAPTLSGGAPLGRGGLACVWAGGRGWALGARVGRKRQLLLKKIVLFWEFSMVFFSLLEVSSFKKDV